MMLLNLFRNIQNLFQRIHPKKSQIPFFQLSKISLCCLFNWKIKIFDELNINYFFFQLFVKMQYWNQLVKWLDFNKSKNIKTKYFHENDDLFPIEQYQKNILVSYSNYKLFRESNIK